MKAMSVKLVLGAAAALLSVSAFATDITGAGASFPYPIISKWAENFQKETGNRLNYQSIGSGGGIRQIKARTVDFGTTDRPLDLNELTEAGLVQFPFILGGVVPIVNVQGVNPGQLKLTGKVLGDIYLGKITHWNAPEIVALNPDLKLPNRTITVVQRADSSGTSFLFTDYLSKVNTEFSEKVGAGTAVKWPVGVGGKGNEGVAANVQRIRDSIGYVEYAYAKRNTISYAVLQNKAGQFVQPNEATFAEASAGVDWSSAPGFGVILTDGPGWPITGASFALMPKQPTNALTSRIALDFFNYAFEKGGKDASDLDYVMLPPAVLQQVRQEWAKHIRDSAGKPVWK